MFNYVIQPASAKPFKRGLSKKQNKKKAIKYARSTFPVLLKSEINK